ncbi:hypothetical protein HUS23_08790 [Ectothiorhodospiraceae bacterium 2226]|nr:hypothetical protein HUS23_08790 [Ectothiorhodospiraceae bacterium 2226]
MAGDHATLSAMYDQRYVQREKNRAVRTGRALRWLMGLAAALLAPPLFAAEREPAVQACPAEQLEQRLGSYAALYPDMRFVNLTGGDATWADLTRLRTLLGPEPVNLDYEHPEDLRETLMRASLGRIHLMLTHQVPSAALFQADRPRDPPDLVCVLTIDPCQAGADDLAATRQLLNLPDGEFGNVPEAAYLRKEDFLEFVVDHEVYHCLKAHTVGPQPMSGKPLWAGYHHHLDEKGADAYALARHIKERGRITAFAENVQRIRNLALYTLDPDHFTCDAIERVLALPVDELAARNEHELLELANDLRAELDPGYPGYLAYIASAIEAIDRLGLGDQLDPALRARVQGLSADEAMVQRLVQRTERCMQMMQLAPE